MNRTLKFVAIVGILLALICLPFAAAIRAAAHGSWFGSWRSVSSWVSDDQASGDSGSIVTRDYAWSGVDRLELDIPGHVRFRPAPTWHLSIRGREGTLNRIVVEDGRIRDKNHGLFFGWHHSQPVEVDLSGPVLHEATLNGSGTIEFQGLDQDSLRVEIRGSGSASGNGKVQSLKLQIMGSGSARLAHLAETNADVTIDGSGEADVSPSGDTQVTIAGSGDVRLHAHPTQLSTHIYGSGHISEVKG